MHPKSLSWRLMRRHPGIVLTPSSAHRIPLLAFGSKRDRTKLPIALMWWRFLGWSLCGR